ncbi:MAG: hypothetical protein PHT60_05100 [Acidiphilium sp.]|nr:hypothetical protein [Acidiphilium sp.]MDD4935140.1 hypothetical protein [Acidiphilium sp.]
MTTPRGPLILIADGSDYALSSSEDRTAFVLTFKTEAISAHLRGDDATRFHTDYQTIRLQYPDWPDDQTLAQLWDQGGYGWLAEETP